MVASDIVENSVIIIDRVEKLVRGILHNDTNYIVIRGIADACGFNIGNQGSIAVLTKQ